MSALTTSEKRAARAALEALRDATDDDLDLALLKVALARLDAQPTADEPAPVEMEPVAYRYFFPHHSGGEVFRFSGEDYNGSKPLRSEGLYTAAHLAAVCERARQQPAPGFTAWVTRDQGSDCGELRVESPRFRYGDGRWTGPYGRGTTCVLPAYTADAILGDARGAGAVRRVRIVPDGEVGDE